MTTTTGPVLTFRHIGDDRIEVQADFPGGRADAEAYAAQFPKSAKMRTSEYGNGGDKARWGLVRFDVRTASDGVNGGVNESGLKRLATIRRTAAKLGFEIIDR